MKLAAIRGRFALVSLLLGLAACGGGSGGDGSTPPLPQQVAIGTLAYVDSMCHEDANGYSGSQRLQLVRGDGAPVTVVEIPTYRRLPPFGLCRIFGENGDGNVSVFAAPLQRLGVSPDGSGVVFEVTLQNSLLAGLVGDPLTPEQEGIFYVRADGTGLRRLGDPSRQPAQKLVGPPSAPTDTWVNSGFWFSPNGKEVAMLDRGPGPDGDATQVFVLDIETGTRTQVTHLPDAPPDPLHPASPATSGTAFVDDTTIGFQSRVNPEGLNPEGQVHIFTVKTDGSHLTVEPLPVLTASGDGVIDPRFFITRAVRLYDVNAVSLPTPPVNPSPYWNMTNEVYVTVPGQELQLTNFHRGDTGGRVVTDGQRVFFTASANLGTNPSENCQIFSISVLGDDLRQLTYFRAADHSAIGCASAQQQPGCVVYQYDLLFDPQARALVFPSNCDPDGGTLNGKQYFAMRPDGTGLRQLTAMRGAVTADDGSVDVELPGPFGYDYF